VDQLYPNTRTVDVEDVLAGVAFPDPYRWLEDDTSEVRDWQSRQAGLASGTVRQWPHYEHLKERVAWFSGSRPFTLLRPAAGQWFRTEMPDGAAQSVAVVADCPAGKGRTLFDPQVENPAKPPFLSWISPSPDGRILALGLCDDGSENNTIRLVEVKTGALLPDPPTQTLMDGWLGGAQWLADSSGFYFVALTGTTHEFRQSAFFYDLTSTGPARPINVPLPSDGLGYHGIQPAPGGRWLVALQRQLNPIPVAVLDLHAENGQWRSFITDLDGTVTGRVVGDRYIAATDIGAPRGRVVAIPLMSTTPNDPATWEELVPESDAVIRTVLPVGDKFYVAGFTDTYAHVRIFAMDGASAGEVPLPGRGALIDHGPMSSAPAHDEFLFSFSTLTSSWGMYSHKPGQTEVKTVLAPEISIANAVVEDHWATSADGTQIPYHVVRLEGGVSPPSRPALLYAYGGFNAPWVPQYPGSMAAFVEAGGLFVHCHLRGGSEFGRDWWEGGRLKNKQNCYQDLYAIAEDLTARGVTRRDVMAVTGSSNGGLMAGVAVAQRPDLWRVVVPRVPFFDIIGGCRDPYGRYAVEFDYGDPDDAAEVRRMAQFSPYQMIEDGIAYPAVYIDAGDTDPRCPPWHSRKFAARLQAAQVGDAPILVHVWDNAGHGIATARHLQIEINSEWLAFVMQQCGMAPMDITSGRNRDFNPAKGASCADA
jgi:prolyl oligopeptidase